MDQEKTSFKQFQYCELCKTNHKRGKKHVYSKHHQTILSNILKKFTSKVESVKKTIYSPLVHDETFETGAKFWCYFCCSEVSKHDVIEETTVEGAGLLEHIASTDHRSNMDQFFWDNLLKKDLKPAFVLSTEELSVFKKAAFLAVKKRQKQLEIKRKQLAEDIAEREKRRKLQLTQQAKSENTIRTTSLEDLPGSQLRTSQSGKDSNSSPGGKHTVSASGEGLSCIKQDTEDPVEGNVHTGATPPWLLPDTDPNTRSEIGPTLEDFNKHKEQLKKSKLPANRVGAKFDHKTPTSADWLPSFGRVWNKGRRLQSKLHFEKMMKKDGQTRSNTATATQSRADLTYTHSNSTVTPGSEQCLPVTPYKRKRQIEETQPRTLYEQIQGSSSSNMSKPTGHSSPWANEEASVLSVNNTVVTEHGQPFLNKCVPYKRRNVQARTSAKPSSFIQTPVLFSEQHS